VGGEHSLWNPLLRDWLVWMGRECCDVAIRAQIDVADRLMEQVQDGVIDLAVLYAPPRRPGIVDELLMEEKLVAATSYPPDRAPLPEDFVFVDWGPNFHDDHHAAFPDAPSPALSVNYGPLAMEYILAVGGAGYFRMEAARPHLETGRLRLVEGKPQFSYSVYAVYSVKADDALMERVRRGLRSAASSSATESGSQAEGLDDGEGAERAADSANG
jgi:DNA-binding transcriptional LysR family regulator